MANTVKCEIVSAERSIFSGDIEQLIAAGSVGDLGILPGHTPLLTELVPGPVRILKQGGEEEHYYVTGGFLEVQPNVITVLADTAVRAKDLDEAAAEDARKEAQQRISENAADLDYTRAASELAEAAAQLRTIQQLRKKAGKG